MSQFVSKEYDPDQAIGGLIQVNQKITVQIHRGNHAGVYPSRIEDIRGNNLVIAGPTYRDGRVPLHVNDSISVLRQMEQGIFEFSVIIKNIRTDHLYQAEVFIPKGEKIKQVNRRGFLRYKLDLPVEFQVSTDEEKGQRHRIKTVSKDLSGSGVCIYLDRDLEAGTPLDIYLTLPQSRIPMYLEGEVVRKMVVDEDKKNPRLEMGIRFTRIRQVDQDKIVKLIFDLERQVARQNQS
jgi:c-di-GMP-binding flagellar brake protein YcgR